MSSYQAINCLKFYYHSMIYYHICSEFTNNLVFIIYIHRIFQIIRNIPHCKFYS